jgi:glycerol-3-phosphate dehydrogenase (NAD(P)+)
MITGNNILFIGAGAIATSLGNILAGKKEFRVLLHTIDEEVSRSVNTTHQNPKFFPTFSLHPDLKATTSKAALRRADIMFLAIPSGTVVDYLESLRSHVAPGTLIVNLAKGFGTGHQTICQCLAESYPNPVCSFKGPTFAREIINSLPTAFTLGYSHDNQVKLFTELFSNTTIFFDHTDDLEGVEILSILKNIYAVVMGIVDAQFDSPNLRFLVLTKAFREMRQILSHFGGKEQTLFNYCGYGDFTLTALNDLSRNRTLGLLIGKGFFTRHVSHDLVLEGKTAVTIFYEELSRFMDVPAAFPILTELHKIFAGHYDISGFVNSLLAFREA